MTDLTDPVNIAPSTFYQFFDSKEELYLEILEREGEQFYERAVAPLEEHSDPERAIVEYLHTVFEELETNPIIERLLADNEVERLLHLYSDEEFVEQRTRELGYVMPYIREWQKAGMIREGDPEVLAATIDSVAVLAFHKDEIGADLYPVVRDTMIETIAAGFTNTAVRDDPESQ